MYNFEEASFSGWAFHINIENLKMTKDKRFERFVEMIEKTLNKYGNVSVKHDVKIPLKNGNKPQIDVLIEVDLGERFGTQRIIIECKLWKTPIPVKEIRQFNTLIETTEAVKGIFVSSKGYQKGGINISISNPKMELYTLEEIDTKKVESWIDVERINLIEPDFLVNELKFSVNFQPEILISGEGSDNLILSGPTFSQPVLLYDYIIFLLKKHIFSSHVSMISQIYGVLGEKIYTTKINLKCEFNAADEKDFILYENQKANFKSIVIELPCTFKKIKIGQENISINHYKDINLKSNIAEMVNFKYNKTEWVIINEGNGGNIGGYLFPENEFDKQEKMVSYPFKKNEKE